VLVESIDQRHQNKMTYLRIQHHNEDLKSKNENKKQHQLVSSERIIEREEKEEETYYKLKNRNQNPNLNQGDNNNQAQDM
jgi:hypothetical protein